MPKSSHRPLAPGAGLEIEQQRTPGGGDVGGERAAQPVQHPHVGGRDRRAVTDLLAQPHDLGGDEVGIELQPGDVGELVGVLARAVRRPCSTAGPARRSPARTARRSRGPRPARSRPGWRARSRRGAGRPLRPAPRRRRRARCPTAAPDRARHCHRRRQRRRSATSASATTTPSSSTTAFVADVP